MVDLFPLVLAQATVRRKGRGLLGPVDLTLPAQGMTMVIGPNGAGKTTLLRVMHGVERLSGGAANWAIPAGQAQARQAYVFQTPIMLRRSVADNLRYPLKLAGLPRAEADERVAKWADRIGLTHRLATPAPRLSGGEKQKLALARALIRQPDVLFLDEPCANLDGASTREIEALLLEAQTRGTHIVMATHDMGQVSRLGEALIFLVGGQVVEVGSVVEALAAPQTRRLQDFLKGEIVT